MKPGPCFYLLILTLFKAPLRNSTVECLVVHSQNCYLRPKLLFFFFDIRQKKAHLQCSKIKEKRKEKTVDLVVIKSLCVFHYGVAAFGGMPNLLFPLSISSSLDQSLPHTHKSQNPTITVWSAMGRARRNPYSWWQPVLSLAFTASVCISFPFLCLSLPVLYLSCYLLTWPSLWLLDLLPNIFLYESISSHIPGIFSKIWKPQLSQLPDTISFIPSSISRQYVMLHSLSPPPPLLFPPKHNFPSSSPMPPVLC